MFGAFTSHVNKTLPLQPLEGEERMFISATGYITTVRGNYSLWESKGLKKNKEKNKKQKNPPPQIKQQHNNLGGNREGSWVPFLGRSLGSQLFQAELTLVYISASSVGVSVCQTLHPSSSPVPLSLQHTHSHSSVQTDLCSSQGEKPVSQYQPFQWIHQSRNTPQTNDVGTRAPTSPENDASSLLSSVMR